MIRGLRFPRFRVRLRTWWRGPSAAPPIAGDHASRFLPVVIAAIMFLAAMTLMATVLLSHAIDRWTLALAGGFTVQVPASTNEAETQAAANRVAEALRKLPGVASAEPLTTAQIGKLLSPWLGRDPDLSELPVPRLVDVKPVEGQRPDLAAIEQAARAVAKTARVDDHGIWLARLVSEARKAEAIALLTLTLVASVAVATIAFLTLIRLSIHREVIDLLHLLGATDGFIATQFQSSAFMMGLTGGAIGTALAAAVIAGLRSGAAPISGLLPPLDEIGDYLWIGAVTLPLASGLIALVSARITVLVRLARLP